MSCLSSVQNEGDEQRESQRDFQTTQSADDCLSNAAEEDAIRASGGCHSGLASPAATTTTPSVTAMLLMASPAPRRRSAEDSRPSGNGSDLLNLTLGSEANFLAANSAAPSRAVSELVPNVSFFDCERLGGGSVCSPSRRGAAAPTPQSQTPGKENCEPSSIGNKRRRSSPTEEKVSDEQAAGAAERSLPLSHLRTAKKAERPTAETLLRFTATHAGKSLSDGHYSFSFSGLDYSLALANIVPSAIDLAALCWSITPIAAQEEANLACFLSASQRLEGGKDSGAISSVGGARGSSSIFTASLLSNGVTCAPLGPSDLQRSVACVGNHIRVQMWLYDLSKQTGHPSLSSSSPAGYALSLRERRAQLRVFFTQTAVLTQQGISRVGVLPSSHFAGPAHGRPTTISAATLIGSSIVTEQSLAGPSLPLHPLFVAAGIDAVAKAASEREREDAALAAVAVAKAAKSVAEAAALQNAANNASNSKFKGVPSCATRLPHRQASAPPQSALAPKKPVSAVTTTGNASKSVTKPAAAPLSLFQHQTLEEQLQCLASSTIATELAEAQLQSTFAVFDECPEAPDFAMLLCCLTRTLPLPTI